MKYNTSVNATDNLGEQERADFQFAVNGKAFKVMLDDLYSNKIRGVIRELSSNAIDAQIEAGVTRPFDMNLPTPLYPEFRIRDYGTGLAHEDVMNMYVTVFESTKDDSNDVTGSFGLGSKIPFAYGDAFIVSSYLNGEKRTYSCNVGDGGVPGITYIKELTAATDEPNGLEVTVSVRDVDCQEFADELAHLQLAFDPKPNVIGGSYDPVTPDWVSKDGKVQVISRDHYGSLFCVKQGSAIYPVNDYRATAGYHSYIDDDYQSSIIIDVPIGTVSISPNREALSIDDNTREALNREIVKALESLSTEISSSLNNLPNRLAVLEAHKGVTKMLAKKLTVDLGNHSKDGKWKPSSVVTLHGGPGWDIPVGRKGNSREKINLNAFNFGSKGNLLFVVSQSKRPVVREGMRYRELVRDIQDSWGDHREVYLLKDPTPRQLERLYTLVGLESDQIISVGSLPDPGPPTRVKKEHQSVTGVRPHSIRDYAIDEIDELPEKYYWYHLPRYNNRNDRYSKNFDYHRFVNSGLIEKDLPLLVFNKSALAKINPPVDMELDTAAEASMVEQRDAVTQAKLRNLLLAMFDERVWETMGVDIPAESDLAEASDYVADTDAEQMRKEIVAPLREKYPLLFGRREFVDIVCYIEDRDNATEGNQS